MKQGTFTPGTLPSTALAYASRGVKIFPLWHVGPGWIAGVPARYICACADADSCGSPGKHPRIPHGVNQATADPERVYEWWTRWPHANIGMPAGANGLAVLDVDPEHGGESTLATLDQWCVQHGVDMWATRTVRTGSGGLHFLYREPAGGIPSKSAAFGERGVDTRGRGGYIVAPPSLHASGQRYELISDPSTPLAPWPDILTQWMEPKQAVGRHAAPPAAWVSTTPRRDRWARAALDREAEALRAMTQEGCGRNDKLNAVAYKIGRRVGAGLLDYGEAFNALVAAASGWRGHTPRAIEATVRSGLNAGMAKPHGGPTTRAAR